MPPGIGYGLTGPRQPPFQPPPHWMSAGPMQGPLDTQQGLQQAINVGGQAPGPSGLMSILQRPGIREALLATGSALMAQSDQPGTGFAGALGRSLPVGAQAYQQGQQRAALDQAMEGAPPQMRQLLQALPAPQRAQALFQMMQPGQGMDPVTVGTNQRLVNPETGETIVGAMPDEEAPPNLQFRDLPDGRIGVLNPQSGEMVNTIGEPISDDPDTYSDASSLRREFAGHISTFDEIAEAANKIEAAATAEPNAANDLALIFNFMKILDPGSAVREGEQATASNAGGVPDRIRGLYNRFLTSEGASLGPEQRQSFLQTAQETVRSQRSLFQERADFFRNIAVNNGFNPEEIIRDPFEGLSFGSTVSGGGLDVR